MRHDQSRDQQRRAEAQKRRPLISQWGPDIPVGYIHIDDAIEYIRRRWGPAIRVEILEAFSRDRTGPKYVIMGDWPDPDRGQRYYKFEDIDMWVYRTFTGVPAAWQELLGQRSSVPVTMVEGPLDRFMLGGYGYGEEQSNGGTGVEEDGRRGDQAKSPEDSDGR